MTTRFSGLARVTLAALSVVAAVAAFPARAADLYGKPLRGLTPVTVASVAAAPEKYAAKAVRVEGKNVGTEGRPALIS